MSKKVLIVGGGVVIVLIIIVSFVLIKPKSSDKSNLSLTSKGEVSVSDDVNPDVLYEDSAGFSLKHPLSITVEDITPQEKDSPFYTLLNLKKGTEALTVAFKDTEYKTIDGMLEKDPDAPKETSLVGATSMDGIPVNQYSYSFNGKDVLLSVALDKGILYLIEGPKDNGFWEKTHNLIISSLSFADKKASASQGGESVIYEAEEVIE